jgi:DNA-binding CsgD family transcriptional regulator
VRSAVVLILTPVALPQAPSVELVQSLFDLTPAEARVARGLAAGKTVDDIATDGGTSANTIRTQVRGVLEKTGCNRQVDVVALLTAISASRLMSPN